MSCQDRVPSEAIFRIPDFSVLRSPTPRSRSISRCMTPAAISSVHESNNITPSMPNRFTQPLRFGTPQVQPLINTGGLNSAIFKREATAPVRIREASIPLTDMFATSSNPSFERLSVTSPIPQLIRRTYSRLESEGLVTREAPMNSNQFKSPERSTEIPVSSKPTTKKSAQSRKKSDLKPLNSPQTLHEYSTLNSGDVDSKGVEPSAVQNAALNATSVTKENVESASESKRNGTKAAPKTSKRRPPKRRINVAAKSVAKSMKKTSAEFKPTVETKIEAESSTGSSKEHLVNAVSEQLNSTSDEKNTSEAIVLKEWRLRKARTGNKLANYDYWIIVEGLRIMSDQSQRIWHSSLIAERINQTTLKTFSGSIYQLSGPISPQGMSVAGFSTEFTNLFKDGFPEEWKSWICVEFDGELSSEIRSKNRLRKTNLTEKSQHENVDAPAALTQIANIPPQEQEDHLQFDNESLDFAYDDHLKTTLNETSSEDRDIEIIEKTPKKAPRRSGRKPKPRINLATKSRSRKTEKKRKQETEEIHSFDAILDKRIVVPQEEESISKASSRKFKMKLNRTNVKETHTTPNSPGNLSEPGTNISSPKVSTSLANHLDANDMYTNAIVHKTPVQSKKTNLKSEKKHENPSSELGITRSGRSVRRPREFWIVEENDHSHTPSKRARRTSEKPAKLKRKSAQTRKRTE